MLDLRHALVQRPGQAACDAILATSTLMRARGRAFCKPAATCNSHCAAAMLEMKRAVVVVHRRRALPGCGRCTSVPGARRAAARQPAPGGHGDERYAARA